MTGKILYQTKANPEWWRSSVIYQIYPRSFADGNGDGRQQVIAALAEQRQPVHAGGRVIHILLLAIGFVEHLNTLGLEHTDPNYLSTHSNPSCLKK